MLITMKTISLYFFLIFSSFSIHSFAQNTQSNAENQEVKKEINSICQEIIGGGLDLDLLHERIQKVNDSESKLPRRILTLREKVNQEGVVKTLTNHALVQNLTPYFSKELPTTTIEDQARAGICHFEAQETSITSYYFAQGLLKQNFSFSKGYNLKMHIAEQANEHFDRLILNPKLAPYLTPQNRYQTIINIEQGGEYGTDAFISDKYGFLPELAMPATLALRNPDMLMLDINKSILETSRALSKGRDQKLPITELIKIRNEGNDKILDILNIYLGGKNVGPNIPFEIAVTELDKIKIPAEKIYVSTTEGPLFGKKVVRFTPLEFKNNYLNYHSEDFILIGSYPKQEFNQHFVVPKLAQADGTYWTSEFLNLPHSELEKLAKKSIDAGRPMWFSADVATGIDNAHGIIHPDIYNTSELYGSSARKEDQKFTAKERSFFGLRTPDHAMTLVGYDRDPRTGRIIKWKVQNSWGKDAGLQANGEKGIYALLPKGMKEQVFEIVIHKSLLTPKLKALLNSKPTPITAQDYE